MTADIQLSDRAYRQIRQFFYQHSGIDLPQSKRHLVAGRLRHRVLLLGQNCYEDYFQLAMSPGQEVERQLLVDLLTTNETYFFREPQHFKLLAEQIIPSLSAQPRIWCAAASSGEEPYSIAMLLADKLGLHSPWQIVGSDLSQRILQRAAQGLYPMQRLELMPARYLKEFCLRGAGDYEGQLLVRRELREHVQLRQHNLMESAHGLGQFEVIFLRNVLIYFTQETKQRVLDLLLQQLKPGGWLVIGHAESLHGIQTALRQVRPSVFRLPQVQSIERGRCA
jgi:chemotaxis protein methyltransferase CheR